MAQDIIFVRELRIPARIGIYAWEQAIRQTVSFDLEMAADIRRAAASDAVADTLDYKAVAKRLLDFVAANRFDLVETLAERAAELLLREFGIGWLRLTVSKPGAVRGARDVGVTIERCATAGAR